MTDPNDDTWLMLNAYIDGELSGRTKRAFARRLSREPELDAAAAVLRAQSDSLRRMMPTAAARPVIPLRPIAWWGAIASTLAMVAFLAFPEADRRTDPTSIHDTFLDQGFPASDGAPSGAGLAHGGPLPDLSPVGLTLVAVRQVEDGVAGHYVGRNACRLTVLSFEAAAILETDMHHTWIARGRRYAILATGMGPDRLAAIRAFLGAVTNPDEDADRLALARRVATTETCA